MGSYFRELQRRNVFRAIAAYIVLGWVLLQVSSTLEETLRLPDWFDAVVTAMLVIGFPVILVFSWIYELTPDGVKKTSSVSTSDSIAQATGRKLDYITLAGIGLLLGVILLDRLVLSDRSEQHQVASTTTEPVVLAAEKSIAVLPFVPMTGTKEDEFFADGLSEELLNVLSQIDGLKVAGRTSAFYYKGRNEDLRVIADALGVAHILEGSVRRSGNQLRVTAQLIKADDGFHLWSETYDRADGDTFVIQDEIASNVADALQTEILGTPMAVATGNRNVEAQNLYLVAQAAMGSRTLPDNRRARDLYARAAVLDPDNPRYLAGYAVAVALQFWNFRDITPNEAITEAGGAIDRALSLGEPSADTLAAAGLVEELRVITASDASAKERALRYYQDAVAKDPNNIMALQWLASIYLDINQPDKSREMFERVVELDPLNILALTGLSNALFGLARYDEGRTHLYKMRSLFPEVGMIYRYLAGIEFQLGRTDKSTYWMERAIEVDPNPLEIAFAIIGYTAFGWADEALDAAARYNQSSNGLDISHLVQAQLDGRFDAIATEAKALFEQNGEADFAVLAAWADVIAGRCDAAVPALERQFPSLQGETLQYLEAADLLDAVLLAHCYAVIGDERASGRLTGLLLTSELLSDNAIQVQPGLRLVRVAANAVADDTKAALAELALIEEGRAPLAISAIALPVDELPVFQALYDEEPFRQYARQERYRIAQQARMLASGETEREIKAQIEAAGFVF
jgi:TolB-like protein/tetratricopeptide (TPR) repeat protein